MRRAPRRYTAGDVRIDFIKLPGNRHVIEVRERKGPDVRRPPRETGPTLPHDLAHAAVERALDIRDGFWSAVAAGVTFEDFEPLERGRHRRSGIKQLRRFSDTLLPAELTVSWAHRVWSGQRTSGRGLGSGGVPLTPTQLKLAKAALDDAFARWQALPEGASLRWDW